jgi:D-amino-acid oxidase
MVTGRPDVVVVGAGVIGLTTAVQLAENGLAVEVRSAVAPERTMSVAAAAMWSLSFVEHSPQVLRWSRDTLECLITLATDLGSGVRLVAGVEASRHESAPPDWAMPLADVRACGPGDLPPGFASGWRFTVPVVDMPVYLGYLRERLRAAGGRLRIQPVRSLADVLGHGGAVVNCTGIRAGRLADDGALYPVRGQIVVAANPGVTEFFAEDTGDDGDDGDLLYILPHGDKVVLGGTAEHGRWDLKPDPGAARAIVARCAAIMPSLAAAPVLAHRVGLRPTRHCVRFEVQRQANGCRLVHSYGHGGAGVSLSWGCARELLGLVAGGR